MDLKDIRNDIDKENQEILKLFLERMENAGKVAEYKSKNNLPVFNPEREREILKKWKRKVEIWNFIPISSSKQLWN